MEPIGDAFFQITVPRGYYFPAWVSAGRGFAPCPPQEHLATSGDILVATRRVGRGDAVTCGYSPGMQLNILSCTGQSPPPPANNHPAETVLSGESEKPYSAESRGKQGAWAALGRPVEVQNFSIEVDPWAHLVQPDRMVAPKCWWNCSCTFHLQEQVEVVKPKGY